MDLLTPHSNPPSRNGFDRIAPVYDLLARGVFGQTLKKARRRFIHQIKAGDRVLIMGGGTGWILPHVLDRLGKSGQVLYVELSKVMIERASARIREHPGRHLVQFLHGEVKDIPGSWRADVIVTHFFLDLFSPDELKLVFTTLSEFLLPQGSWLIADFSRPAQAWHIPYRILIALMYLFFRLTCGISAKRLQNFQAMFFQHGFQLKEQDQWWRGMISSRIYSKESGE